MKKTLMLSAMALLVAGGVTGCANCCGSGSDCDDVVWIEAVEVTECPMCSKKHKCKTMHKHNKNCKEVKSCRPAASCQDENCQEHKKEKSGDALQVRSTACADTGKQGEHSGNAGSDTQK